MGVLNRKRGIKGTLARFCIVSLSLFSLNARADLIVDLGSAADFMFLDISENPAMDAVFDSGVFTGKIGWSGGSGTQVSGQEQLHDASACSRRKPYWRGTI